VIRVPDASVSIPEDLRKAIPPLYTTEASKNPVAYTKFFTPDRNWTWYVLEFDGEDLCFGYVEGFEKEYGYFRLSELRSVRGPFGPPIERDLYFRPTSLGSVK